MQKVLHIIPRLGNGGAEKLLLSTAPHYLKHNLKIKIICLTSESQICDELRSRSIDVLCMHGKGRMYDLLTVKDLLKTIKNEKPDIVISHLLMANFFAFISCFLTFKKHIPVIHNLNTEYSIKDKFLNFLIKIFSYRIICVSNAVKTFEDINQPAFVKSKTRVLYNAIDISFFEKNTCVREHIKKETDFNLLCSCRIVSQKRHKDLLYAFSESKYLQKAKLTILGDGPLLDEIKELSKSLNVYDRCIFTGHVDDVAIYLDKADIFVYPSEREGNPLALIEALARGLPVILSDIDCHKELFPEKDIFFKTKDVSSLTKKIDNFCKDNLDYFNKNKIIEADLDKFNPKNYVKNFLTSIE